MGDACGVGATCGVGGTSIVGVAAGVASGEVADAAGAGALLKTRPNKDAKILWRKTFSEFQCEEFQGTLRQFNPIKSLLNNWLHMYM